MQTELRKHFIIFLIFSGIVIIALLSLPFVEPKLKESIGSFFEITETVDDSLANTESSSPTPQITKPVETVTTQTKMSETATSLFDNLFKIFKLLLWMGLIIAIVKFINAVIFKTVLKNTSNYELATLLRNVLSIIIYVVAFATIFKSQFPGTDLSTIFAGSTIVGVVLGLALQDTLGNLFAGLAMQADQPFQIGDIINVQNKAIGVVESISWRGVKIRTFQNSIILVSNSIISKEFIEVAPKDDLVSRNVFFHTRYSHSPAKTIQLIREIVRQVDNVSPKIRPIVRIRNLGENGIDWEVKYWLIDYSLFNDTDALIRQRIWYAFEREEIQFAHPIRKVFSEENHFEPDEIESANEIFLRLSDVTIFAPLNDEETHKLAESSELKLFSPNELIVRKDQEGKSMFVIHRGSVKVQIIENGVPKTINTLQEGEIFGEMGLFTGEPRSANVVAAEETEVLEIKHSAVKLLFKNNPHLAEDLSQTIAERQIMLSEANKTTETVEIKKESVFSSIKKFFGLRQ